MEASGPWFCLLPEFQGTSRRCMWMPQATHIYSILLHYPTSSAWGCHTNKKNTFLANLSQAPWRPLLNWFNLGPQCPSLLDLCHPVLAKILSGQLSHWFVLVAFYPLNPTLLFLGYKSPLLYVELEMEPSSFSLSLSFNIYGGCP